ncbi:hypothetical protein Bca4012_084698 [Brassica carinata]
MAPTITLNAIYRRLRQFFFVSISLLSLPTTTIASLLHLVDKVLWNKFSGEDMRSLTRARGYSSYEVDHGYASFFVDVENEKKVAVGCDIIYEEKMTNNTASVNGDRIGVYREVDLGNLIFERRLFTQENTYDKLFCCH